MIAVLREVLHVCCMTIAVLCGIAALTIAAAIISNKAPDPQTWMAVVFFTAIGIASWIVGRAVRT